MQSHLLVLSHFSPTGSRIAQHFLPLFPGTLIFQTERPAGWPEIQNILEGHTGSVLSVAFLPDGRCIASGSDDKTICVWDVEMAGTEVHQIDPALEM